jgi:hypothetical protein
VTQWGLLIPRKARNQKILSDLDGQQRLRVAGEFCVYRETTALVRIAVVLTPRCCFVELHFRQTIKRQQPDVDRSCVVDC